MRETMPTMPTIIKIQPTVWMLIAGGGGTHGKGEDGANGGKEDPNSETHYDSFVQWFGNGRPSRVRRRFRGSNAGAANSGAGSLRPVEGVFVLGLTAGCAGGSIASLVGIGIVAGGIAAAVALALPWLPDPASKEADRIDPLFWFVIVICIVVFAVVIAVMTYSIIHFRAAPDDMSDGPPIHGHTGLEIVWTIIPTILVTVIGIVSAVIFVPERRNGCEFPARQT